MLVCKREGKRPLGRPRRIILKCIYENYDIKIRTRNRISTARFCEYSNEPWGSEGGGDIVTS
jgi:hypothetical protein